MGLFKKRSTDPEELEQLRADIATMAERLNAADEAKARLHGEVQGLASRLETPIPPPPAEPPPPPVAPSIDPTEIDKLHAKFDRLSHRIDEVDGPSSNGSEPVDPEVVAQLRARLDDVSHRLDADDANDDTEPTIDPEQIGRLQARIDDFAHRLDSNDANPAIDPEQIERLDKTMSELGHRIDELDGRITAISTELANQINELGADPAINDRDATPVATELVGDLRDAQERLASEQARYQIAFRQDLADLADRFKRT